MIQVKIYCGAKYTPGSDISLEQEINSWLSVNSITKDELVTVRQSENPKSDGAFITIWYEKK